MKRLFIKRSELCIPDVTEKNIGYVTTLQDYVGIKECTEKLLTIKSGKTGNVSRVIHSYPVEIENVSPVYYLLNTDKMIRKSDRVFLGDKEAEVVPVARIKHINIIIADIKVKS